MTNNNQLLAARPWLSNSSSIHKNKRAVFLAWGDIFVGDKSQSSTSRAMVLAIVQQHWTEREQLTIGPKLGQKSVVKYVLLLLEEGWMEDISPARQDLGAFFKSRATKTEHDVVGISKHQHNTAENHHEDDNLTRNLLSFRGQEENMLRSQVTKEINSQTPQATRMSATVDSHLNHPKAAWKPSLVIIAQAQRRIDPVSGRIQKTLKSSTKVMMVWMRTNSTKEDEMTELSTDALENAKVAQTGGPSGKIYTRAQNLTYLPFKAQHQLLSAIQKVLEECCFDFVQKWLPEVLQEQGWEIPESGELTNYWDSISKSKVPCEARDLSTDELLSNLFARIRQIRHAAVHRIQTPVLTVEAMLQDSVKLASTLGDEPRVAVLMKWQKKLAPIVSSLKIVLKNKRSGPQEELRRVRKGQNKLNQELLELIHKETKLEQELDNISSTQETLDEGMVSSLMEIFSVTDHLKLCSNSSNSRPTVLDGTKIVCLGDVGRSSLDPVIDHAETGEMQSQCSQSETGSPENGNTFPTSDSGTRPHKRPRMETQRM